MFSEELPDMPDDVTSADCSGFSCEEAVELNEVPLYADVMLFSLEGFSFRSPQPVRREAQTAAHNKTVESLFALIKIVLSQKIDLAINIMKFQDHFSCYYFNTYFDDCQQTKTVKKGIVLKYF